MVLKSEMYHNCVTLEAIFDSLPQFYCKITSYNVLKLFWTSKHFVCFDATISVTFSDLFFISKQPTQSTERCYSTGILRAVFCGRFQTISIFFPLSKIVQLLACFQYLSNPNR